MALTLALATGGTPALAADDSANGAPSANAQIQEIVVTAQKRSENLQKASISINAVRGEDLAKSGVHDAAGLQDLVPNVKFSAADELTVSIRGLGTTNINGGVDSAVAYSEDGLYLSHPAALSPLLFDMQRVEVLLGPQGTLYGRNSNAGVVNFISADPEFRTGGHAQIGYGNYNALNSELAVNLPLSDKLALRIAGASEQHGPYVADGTNDSESYAARMKLLYKPTDTLSILLAATYSAHRTTGTSYGWKCPPGLAGVPACAGTNTPAWSGIYPANSPLQGMRDHVWGVSATVNLEMPWANFTSLTGYKYYNYHSVNSPGLVNGTDEFDYHHLESDKFFTQELRLTSKPGSHIKWSAGLYYSDDTQPYSQIFQYNSSTAVQLAGGPDNFYQQFAFTGTSYKSAAAFGDLTVPVRHDVRLRAGLRYTVESKDATGQISQGITGYGQLGDTSYNPSHEAAWRLTWSAGLDWDISPRNLFYVTASNGYKSGGLNSMPASTGLTTYGPEKITAVEIGLKNRFLGNRLQVNMNLFHYAYDGYQALIFYMPTGGPLLGDTLFPTVNSQTATFEGGEVQAIWKLTANDRLSFGFNYLHDRFGRFVVALPYAATQDLSGSRVPQAPETTVTIGLDHTFHLPGDMALNLGASTQFVSSYLAQGNYTQYSDAGAAIGTGYYTQGAFHKTSLTATLTAHGGWTLSAFARNIENKATINTIAGGYPIAQNILQANAMVDPPRTFGFALRKDF
ncbi:MAG TPA: TonB-dependent receptor [Novosphingobium sp.]|nr:TonB-dependent receptor [Novosphingobium sp.]